MKRKIVHIVLSAYCILYFTSCNSPSSSSNAIQTSPKPNFIIIFADDLGYGDLSSYGHPTIKTPHLDQLAREGQKWTQFYSAASVCTPSRAGLMTGRYPIRSGMCDDRNRVLFPNSTGGLPSTEITLAEQLKSAGYRTAAIGKWHLGHQKEYLPTQHGFDSYFGIPYSNDMDPIVPDSLSYHERFLRPRIEYFHVPLIRDTTVVEQPANQFTITKRYTEEAVKIINQNLDTPFFIYLAHSLPHVPLFASKDFQNTSARGLYGDVIQEIDHGVGKVVEALKENQLEDNTIIVFTSDNGPWLTYGTHGGSAGLLKDGKGTTWEGGMRVPAIFWGPGHIKPEVISTPASTLDLFPTVSSWAGVPLPENRHIDGHDLTPILSSGKSSDSTLWVYYRGTEVYAARYGAFKVHYITETAYAADTRKTVHESPLLFNLHRDPEEKYNIAESHPDILKHIDRLLEQHLLTVKPVKSQLAERK